MSKRCPYTEKGKACDKPAMFAFRKRTSGITPTYYCMTHYEVMEKADNRSIRDPNVKLSHPPRR